MSVGKATIRPEHIWLKSMPYWWIWSKKFENITRVLEDSIVKVVWTCISASQGLVKGLCRSLRLDFLHYITPQCWLMIGGLWCQWQNGDWDWSTLSAYIFWYPGPFEFSFTAYWSARHKLHPDIVRFDGCLSDAHTGAVPSFLRSHFWFNPRKHETWFHTLASCIWRPNRGNCKVGYQATK